MDTHNLKFDEMNLAPELLQAIASMGFEKASPIQALSIPVIMQGQDMIGQAQTGTGKTCAFGIPMIQRLMTEKHDGAKAVQGLILCPTRELAVQVSEELSRLLKFKSGIKVLPVYGGQPIEHQLKALKVMRPQIIVGTPGRVFDHIERKTLDLGSIKMLVLDEADEMLNMGFRDAIEEILEHVNDDAQTIFFSATMAKDILQLTKKYQTNPKHVQVAHTQLTVPQIEQFYIEVGYDRKTEALIRVLDLHHGKLSVIFCNTKRKVDDVVEELQRRGYFAGGLHGDLKQKERDRVMNSFRQGNIEILVATDIAARGIDVDDVEAVYNLDLPYDEEDYVHRIGRTGRVGKKGKSFSFVVGREIHNLKRIAKFTNSKITPMKPPTASDVEESKVNQMLEKIKGQIQDGHLDRYEKMVEKLCSDTITSLDVAAALLRMSFDTKKAVPKETAEPKMQKERPHFAPKRPDRGNRFGKDKPRFKGKSFNKRSFS